MEAIDPQQEDLMAFEEVLEADFQQALHLCQSLIPTETLKTIENYLTQKDWKFAYDALTATLKSSPKDPSPKARGLLASISTRVADETDDVKE